MSVHNISTAEGRDIQKGRQYILVRVHEAGHLVVNVMEVVTEPTFDRDREASFFQARGLSVNGRQFEDEETATIELSLDEIGCPWKGDRSGTKCRTFAYDDLVHQILLDVRDKLDLWLKLFNEPTLNLRYEVSQSSPGFTNGRSGALVQAMHRISQ